ncbi:hypothetical protein I553_1942 [Mycobacterium xenopi 4042]|uniref:Uncharacterized protein n=1 Tax=Mycobacterium xenopi 4042 TaxID=1299334 RepID=X8DK43_MYCXE|nr:hypothetical protein I553_1942 [Mycobacterium xenopi 4042]
MSRSAGFDPEARATIDAVLAKLAAPACATRPISTLASAAPRRSRPSSPTPEALPSATTTR